MKIVFRLGLLPSLFFSLSVFGQASISQMLTDQQMVSSGKELFGRHCMGCHGIEADGKGAAAFMLYPKPRNLLKGSFKFRSTPSGTMPTTADLIRTIDQGVLGTSMPSFRLLSEPNKLALALYIKSLRKDWMQSEGTPLVIPPAPLEIFGKKRPMLEAARKGYVTFVENCSTCHGQNGLGDGESAATLTDDDDMPIRPANYMSPYIKSGRSARDIYKAISTGLDGSPMPAFADSFSEAQRWELVAYIMFRRGQGAGIYPADQTLEQVSVEFPDPKKSAKADSTSSSTLPTGKAQ